VTKSSPFGTTDAPFNPISLALGAGATFVARTLDTDKQHLPAMLRAAAAHPGAALIEIYQNCPVFNDGAFDALTDKQKRDANVVSLEHGQPIRFGVDGERGVVRDADGDLQIATVAAVGEDALVVHDAHREDPGLAFALSRLVELDGGVTPVGIFRQAPRQSAAASLATELLSAHASFGLEGLSTLLHAADTWSVGA
jgi:2-oxoglutarate ferredoxin oxidoreductase subunit beta